MPLQLKGTGKFMLYGATGFTGSLTVEEYCKRERKHTMVIAGRAEKPLKAMAEKYQLEYRSFKLNKPYMIDENLRDIDAVLLMAGPFVYTARPMLEACMRTKTHYFDITGETKVLQELFELKSEIARSEIACVPGTGFHSVTMDCLARLLQSRLPSATHLAISDNVNEELSAGTLKSIFEQILSGVPPHTWMKGEWVPVDLFYKNREIHFFSGTRIGSFVPWGDLLTLHESTIIPNIDTFMPLEPEQIKKIRSMITLLETLSYIPGSKFLLNKAIEKFVHGPDQSALKGKQAEVWAEVKDSQGNLLSGTITTCNAYVFTAICTLRCIDRFYETAGLSMSPGTQTASQAFTPEFLQTIPSVIINPFQSKTRFESFATEE